jgi:two-component system response regulator PilR (NtrC family)
VDVRIVSATHKDLAAEVQAQQFRQDLFYRLNVIEILIPPLRERREDLPALCAALLHRIEAESGMQVPLLSNELIEQLGGLRLSGNVRELENLLHRAVALSDGAALHMDFVPTQSGAIESLLDAVAPGVPTPTPVPPSQDLQTYLNQLERDVLIRALQEHHFNRTAAAASIGLNLRQIRYRMARLNIQSPKDDDGATDAE